MNINPMLRPELEQASDGRLMGRWCYAVILTFLLLAGRPAAIFAQPSVITGVGQPIGSDGRPNIPGGLGGLGVRMGPSVSPPPRSSSLGPSGIGQAASGSNERRADGDQAIEIAVEVAVTDPGRVRDDSRWVTMFRETSVRDVRVTYREQGIRPQLTEQATGGGKRIQLLTVVSGGRMEMPDGTRFSPEQSSALATWLTRLSSAALMASPDRKVQFGLTSPQFRHVQQALGSAFLTSTLERPCRDVAREATAATGLSFSVTPAATGRFRSSDLKVTEELKGLSAGTVLAATLRPLGLVAVPRMSDSGRLELRIAEAREEQDVWPVGWPRVASTVDLAPKLYESTEIEVADVPLSAVIGAVSSRGDVPVLVDRNSLTAGGIDITTAKVRFPLRKATYMRLLEATAAQARVSVEVRQDDAGRPFVWLSAK